MREDNCATVDIYGSLPFCPGNTTMPGVRDKVYFIRKAHIVKWPKYVAGKYVGKFTLASGKYFKMIQVVVNKSKFTAQSQGEAPNKTFRQHLEMMHPLLDEDFAVFENSANNDDIVYLVQESKGKFKVLGCKEYPSDTSFSDDSGSAATDAAGSTITAECDAPTGLLIYEDEILTDANEDAQEYDDDEEEDTENTNS